MRAFVVLGLVVFPYKSREIGLGKRLRNDLFCVECDVKPQLIQSISQSVSQSRLRATRAAIARIRAVHHACDAARQVTAGKQC